MTAGSLSTINGALREMVTHVMLLPLLSTDPNTAIVLMRRFCVEFSVISGELSSNPLFLRSEVILSLFTSHSMSIAKAVHVKYTVMFSAAFTDSGGATNPVKMHMYNHSLFSLHCQVHYYRPLTGLLRTYRQ